MSSKVKLSGKPQRRVYWESGGAKVPAPHKCSGVVEARPRKGELQPGCRTMACTCEHRYQDGRYGKGLRVHNPMRRVGNAHQYRCTVCAKVR
jgi:hypothetical protein